MSESQKKIVDDIYKRDGRTMYTIKDFIDDCNSNKRKNDEYNRKQKLLRQKLLKNKVGRK